MANELEGVGSAGNGGQKKKRVQGPRKPQPIYVFITKNDEGKTTVSKSFRNPRAMAEYIPTSMQNGEELLVLTPE